MKRTEPMPIEGELEPIARDSVDRLVAAWAASAPDLAMDTTRIFARMQHLGRFFDLALERVARRHGIASGDVYVLLALRRAPGPLTPTQLFRELSVTTGAITKRVGRLVTAGLAVRRADPHDGRSVSIGLTPAGGRIVDEGITNSSDFIFRVVYELDTAERDLLERLLRRLLVPLERDAGDRVGHMGALLTEPGDE